MIKRFLGFWSDPDDQTNVRYPTVSNRDLTEQFQVFALLSFPVYLTIFLITGHWLLVGFVIGLASVIGLTMVLNRQGKTAIARQILIYALLLGVLGIGAVLGRDSGIHLLLFPLLFVPCLFSRAKIGTDLIVPVVLILGSYLFLEFSSPLLNWGPKLSSELTDALYVLSFIIAITMVLGGLLLLLRYGQRSERAIRHNELQNRALLNAMPDTIFRMRGDGALLDYKAGQQSGGIGSNQVMGGTIFEVLPDAGEQLAESIGQALESNQMTTLEYSMGQDAVAADFEVRLVPTGDDELIALLRDITEQKQAERQLKRQQEEARKLALVASRTDNAVIITDDKGQTEWVNHAFTTITGYSLEEAVGLKPGELLQGEDTDQSTVLFMRECLMLGNGFQVEILNYTKSGKPYWVEIEVQPIYSENGRLKQFFAIQNDITQRKQYEETLKAARDTAEAAAQAKSEFLSNMSHEIRTPMNAIIGITDILLKTPTDEDSLTNLKRIKYSANNLLILINDILDFSKIEAGKLPIEYINFNIRQLFNEHIQSIAIRAEEKNIKLIQSIDPEIPTFLVGDPLRLNQILLNLTSNAIKFTDTGHVNLTLSLDDHKDDRVRLRFAVEDTGIGIKQEKLVTIFESFTQADTRITRKYGGTGLGLSITKKLIELQGGTIEVESEVGSGSVFSFVLPFKVSEGSTNSQPEPEEAEAEFDQDLSGRHMLLVEDNLINQFVAEQLLRSWTIEVDKALNGLEAIALLKKRSYDAILMDIQMPEMDGFEATRIIRDPDSEVLDHDVPIIAVSADVFPETKERAIEMGMNDFITKPIDQDELYEALLNSCQELSTIDAPREPDNQPTPTVEETQPASSRLNLDFIKENVSDDPDFIRELLLLFQASNRKDLEELVAAGQSDDLERLRGIAHKLKSSFRSLGLLETADILFRIESAAKDNNLPDNLQDLIGSVTTHFEEASAEIDRYQ